MILYGPYIQWIPFEPQVVVGSPSFGTRFAFIFMKQHAFMMLKT